MNLLQIEWHCLDDKDMPAFPDLLQVKIILLNFIIDITINTTIDIKPKGPVSDFNIFTILIMVVMMITITMLQGEMDFINSVCPCAGLSMLNRQKEGNVSIFILFAYLKISFQNTPTVQSGRGADAAQNEWMLKSANYVLSVVRPKVCLPSFAFFVLVFHPTTSLPSPIRFTGVKMLQPSTKELKSWLTGWWRSASRTGTPSPW